MTAASTPADPATARFLPSSARAAALTTLFFYSAAFLVLLWAMVMLDDMSLSSLVRVAVPMNVVDGMLAFSLYFPLRWTRAMAPLPRWTILIASTAVVSALQSGWDTLLRHWQGSLLTYYASAYEAFVRATTVNFYQTGMLLALLAFQAAYLEARDNERKLRVAREGERSAHMAALRFQLNPHFLFNTMNALSALVVLKRNEQAEEMIDRLASFLRASLASDPNRLVRLEDEFDMLDSYLEIERARFEDRLETSIRLPTELRDACIPAFILQPLVENAMKYAVAPARRSVTLSISAAAEEEALVLCVADDGDGAAGAPGTGLGHANIRERLALEYGANARFDISREAGFAAEIRLPLERALGGDGSVAAGRER